MKNLAIALFTTLMLAACSSGNSSADLPQNLTGLYQGSFQNTPGTQTGDITFNLAQAADTSVITGNLITANVTGSGSITCVPIGTVTGTVTGFNAMISSGITTFQLTVSNNGNTLSGTYTSTTAAGCSGSTGSGTVTVNR